MLKYLLWGFVIYLLYRFIFQFVIPISRTVSAMKKNMRQMQDQQPFQQTPFQQTPFSNMPKQEPVQKQPTSNNNDEYIDFEEVKN